MAARLESVHPVLMSSDLSASIAFYERLGFRQTFQDRPVGPTYAGVGRDGVELHLQLHDRVQWACRHDRPTYRFLVADVEGFFAMLREAGAIPKPGAGSPWASPGDTPWGTREFHVLDPDGNGLQFYSSTRRIRT
jgi:catechol 2,3-dioxygenase-like lactoylglutathione lyase family enzyme